MPQPSPSWQTVPVYATYKRIDGTAAAGSVSFSTVPRINATTDDTIFLPGGTIIGVLDGDGHMAVDLPATDDTDVTPRSWSYLVSENFIGGGGSNYYIEPVLSMLPNGLDLLTVVLDDATTPSPAVLRGVAGGLAGLDADGDVNDAAGNKILAGGGGGGGGAVASVNGHTGTVVLTKTDVGLGNVDNTSDANKPVSTAQAAADTSAKARANHTGTQTADTITNGSTNHVFTATMDAKLAGVATAATANQTDAYLLSRANHTGTQAPSTISGLATVATSGSAADLTGTLPIASMPALDIYQGSDGTWPQRSTVTTDANKRVNWFYYAVGSASPPSGSPYVLAKDLLWRKV